MQWNRLRPLFIDRVHFKLVGWRRPVYLTVAIYSSLWILAGVWGLWHGVVAIASLVLEFVAIVALLAIILGHRPLLPRSSPPTSSRSSGTGRGFAGGRPGVVGSRFPYDARFARQGLP